MKQTLFLILAALLLTGCTAGSPADTGSGAQTDPLPAASSVPETSHTRATETAPESHTPTTSDQPTVPPASKPEDPDAGYRCDPYLFYANLSDPLYYADACRLVDTIAAHEDYLPVESADAAEAIADNIFYNFPPAALCTFEADEGGIRIGYTYDKDEHRQRIADFYTQVETILNETVDPAWSDLHKAMELYRAVSVNVSYFTVDYTEADTSAYSAITRRLSICYGFADCYNYLLRQVGIEAELLRGYRAGDRADHGWSLIRLDGEWYHCDTTWESSGTEGIGLQYFGMTDSKRFSSLARAAVCGFGALERVYTCDQATDSRFVTAFTSSKWRYGPWEYEDAEKQLAS